MVKTKTTNKQTPKNCTWSILHEIEGEGKIKKMSFSGFFFFKFLFTHIIEYMSWKADKINTKSNVISKRTS